jgi:hypothetical protein
MANHFTCCWFKWNFNLNLGWRHSKLINPFSRPYRYAVHWPSHCEIFRRSLYCHCALLHWY